MTEKMYKVPLVRVAEAMKKIEKDESLEFYTSPAGKKCCIAYVRLPWAMEYCHILYSPDVNCTGYIWNRLNEPSEDAERIRSVLLSVAPENSDTIKKNFVAMKEEECKYYIPKT